MSDNRDLILLLELVKKHNISEIENFEEINEFVQKHFIETKFGGKALSTDYRVMNIMNEWKAMFSYSPGCIKGSNIIIALLKRIIDYPETEMIEIFNSEEWVELTGLRGPVETVIEKQCKKCNGIFYVMGVSGFLDGAGLVCNKCGSVYFKSYYDDSELPNCNCGGQYKDECPYCGHKSANTVGYKSPYWYFENHGFIRGNGF